MKVFTSGLLCIVLGTFVAATGSQRVRRNTYGGSGSGSSSSYTSSPNYRTGSYTGASGSYPSSSYGSPYYGAGSNAISSYPSQGGPGTYQANPYPIMYVVPMYQQTWEEGSEEEPGIDLLAIKSAVAKAVLGAIGKVKGSILAATGKVIQTKGNIVAAKGGALLKLGQALKSLGGTRGSSSYSQDYSSSSYNGYK